MPPYRLLTREELAAIASEHGINSENVHWGSTDPLRFHLATTQGISIFCSISVSILSREDVSKIVTRSFKKKAGNHQNGCKMDAV